MLRSNVKAFCDNSRHLDTWAGNHAEPAVYVQLTRPRYIAMKPVALHALHGTKSTPVEAWSTMDFFLSVVTLVAWEAVPADCACLPMQMPGAMYAERRSVVQR